MDLRDHLVRLLRCHPVAARIRRLSKGAGLLTAHPALTPAARGGALLAFSLLVGMLAHHRNQIDAGERWLKENRPSAETWTAVLRSEGLRSVTDPMHQHRILRTLPATIDAPGSVWWTEHFAELVVFAGDQTEPRVFESAQPGPKRDRAAKPAWQWAGRGWEGMEKLITALRARPPRVTVAKTRVQTRVRGDTRAIQY